ncbi:MULTISPECIES: hypothetical protein [Enterococcus]|uniref:hypothetical protein n=1 Tax=Enterococcus TaxID=1350 RepID=UPI00147563C4|nr:MULTISPECIES: hypothetical protein [Enterococcus]MBE6170523.1 hypothetical protein [Enterococcus casseliflavus]MCI5685593.1 hypothetical protein [Enterococcus gallinarum]MCO5478582.1 hypothetical protein [Enterococcus gallinarum]MDN6949199.1 hypothetical protein [Enterococcus faecium]MDV7822140.1 hypothetical protein [Enterococcus gallinarum]
MKFLETNRQCYNSYYVPFETLYYASWPPTYVTCDCGELAEHIVHYRRLPCGAPHFENTFIWKCIHCGARYRQIKGTFDFERMVQERDNPNDADGK